jgi:hypothetical protein
MRGRSAGIAAAGFLLAASLNAGWAWGGCDDPDPINCPPKPPCPPTCESATSVLSQSHGPKTHGAFGSRGRSAAWLVLTLRTVAGAMKAI